MAIFGAIAAATEKRRKKELLEELKMLGAVDKSAVPAENIRKYPYDKHRIESLVNEGKIGKTSDGRLYLLSEK